MEPQWPREGEELVMCINCVWEIAFTYDSKVCLNSGSQMQRTWCGYLTCQHCIRDGCYFSQEVRQHNNNTCSHFSRTSFPFSYPKLLFRGLGSGLASRHALREIMNHYSTGLLWCYCTNLKTEKKKKNQSVVISHQKKGWLHAVWLDADPVTGWWRAAVGHSRPFLWLLHEGLCR